MVMKVGRSGAKNDDVEDKDVDDGNSGSKDNDNGNSKSKGDDEDGWCFHMEGIPIVTDTPSAA